MASTQDKRRSARVALTLFAIMSQVVPTPPLSVQQWSRIQLGEHQSFKYISQLAKIRKYSVEPIFGTFCNEGEGYPLHKDL